MKSMAITLRASLHPATLFCALALLTACGGSPALRHYLITPAPVTGAVVTLPPGTVIGLGPVAVPDYLARPQMAVRASPSRVEYRDADRWAEPLADNLRRVLKEDLVAALPGAVVHAYPWPRSLNVDYQVRVEITRFDADAGGNVTLEGNWSLRNGLAGALLPAQPIALSASATDVSPDSIATAHGMVLSTLAREIATGLSLLPALN